MAAPDHRWLHPYDATGAAASFKLDAHGAQAKTPMIAEKNLLLLCVFAHPDDEVFCVGGCGGYFVHPQ